MGDQRFGEQIKKLWHEACFKRVGVASPTPENKNRIKYHFEATDAWMPLRQFVRGLLKDGNPLAKDWLAHKKGSLNQKRNETNQMIARAAAQASRLARKSKKSGSGGGSKDAKVEKPKAAKGI